MILTLEERIQRSRQAPADSGAPDCCKVPGALDVSTEDGERFLGVCRACGRKHRRAFPDLSKIMATTDGVNVLHQRTMQALPGGVEAKPRDAS